MKTYEEISNSWSLWCVYVDPMATMTQEEFEKMSIEEKVQFQIECFE